MFSISLYYVLFLSIFTYYKFCSLYFLKVEYLDLIGMLCFIYIHFFLLATLYVTISSIFSPFPLIFTPYWHLCAEEPCLEGVARCRDGTSFSTDSRGVIRCCMPGFILNSATNTYINGVLVDFCSCQRMPNVGFMSKLMAFGNAPAEGTVNFDNSANFGREYNATGLII